MRIFTENIGGRGIGSIAAGLNRDSIPSPYGHDPARNRHRASANGAWGMSAVRAILGNPRYTGRQVWNPDWTVGHVLTHLARNAESYVRMLRGAMQGEHLEQYAGGRDQRAADIEAGASRPTVELVEEVVETAAGLDDAWTAMSETAWDGYGLSLGRIWPCRELPLHRWREVEVHHVDVGLGYGVEDWPADYVAIELPRALAKLPERMTEEEDRRTLLAWLFGRVDNPGPLRLHTWRGGPGT